MSATDRQLVAFRASPVKERDEERRRKSSLRELHISVFDVIARGKGRGGTVFVGQGSWMYDTVGKWVPSGVVGWMMALRKGSEVENKARDSSQEWENVGIEEGQWSRG